MDMGRGVDRVRCTERVTWKLMYSSVHFSLLVVSDSLRSHGLQHARPPCPSPTPRIHPTHVHWVRDAIKPSYPLSSPSPPAFNLSQYQGFSKSQFSTWGGQRIAVSASTSVLPMNTQDWSPWGWTDWISLQSKGLSKIFSNTTVQKHQFFGTQISLKSKSQIHTWPLEKP